MTFDLTGDLPGPETTTVLEASAGTGKTFALAALVTRYLAEGIRRQEFPEITFRDGALGRRAALAGSRLDVWQVVETVRAHASSVDEAAVYLDLPADRVLAAVRYAAAHRDEIDEITAREHATADRAEDLWRATQEFLAS